MKRIISFNTYFKILLLIISTNLLLFLLYLSLYFYTIQESAGHKSGIWIDGEKRFFTEKEWICGDMSREHSLFNKDKIYSKYFLYCSFFILS